MVTVGMREVDEFSASLPWMARSRGGKGDLISSGKAETFRRTAGDEGLFSTRGTIQAIPGGGRIDNELVYTEAQHLTVRKRKGRKKRERRKNGAANNFLACQ